MLSGQHKTFSNQTESLGPTQAPLRSAQSPLRLTQDPLSQTNCPPRPSQGHLIPQADGESSQANTEPSEANTRSFQANGSRCWAEKGSPQADRAYFRQTNFGQPYNTIFTRVYVRRICSFSRTHCTICLSAEDPSSVWKGRLLTLDGPNPEASDDIPYGLRRDLYLNKDLCAGTSLQEVPLHLHARKCPL